MATHFMLTDGDFIEVALSAPACRNLFIHVDLGGFSNKERNSWLYNNKNLLFKDQTSSPVYLVDPEELIKQEQTGNLKCIDWLTRNQYLIDFEMSKAYMLCRHRVNDPNTNRTLSNAAIIDQMTVPKLIEKIEMRGGADCFEHTVYENYVFFFQNPLGGIQVDFKPYEADQNCFSVPFLKAILGEDPETMVVFKLLVETDNNISRSIIVFTLQGTGTPGHYYNFSHIPPNP